MKYTIIFISLFLILIVIFTFGNIIKTEVETYTIGMEITEKDFSSYHVKNVGDKTDYIMCLRGSGHATVLEVNAQTYAAYAEGDIVEVEVRVMESKFKGIWNEYKILGLQK